MARRLICPGVVAEDRILVVVEASDAGVIAPGLLHELELASDVRVDAEEMDAARHAVVGELEQCVPAGRGRGIFERGRIEQRRAERPRSAEQTIPPGLWSASCHPNYFGEVLFWWGLFLFVPLAHPDFWWAIAGPIAILLLFLGISIPMMERHLLAEHPTYAEYQRRVSPFVPWVSR